jgi:hypothetical protein
VSIESIRRAELLDQLGEPALALEASVRAPMLEGKLRS